MTLEDAKSWFDMLSRREPPQGLKPVRPWDAALSERLKAASFGEGPDALTLKAALLLWNDDLHASHALVQDIHTPTGSLLHGIMHRMEGDYWNAEYWFRRTGRHKWFREIAAAVAAEGAERYDAFIGGGVWDPFAFNRAVQRALEDGGSRNRESGLSIKELERIQYLEMSTVTELCMRACFGGKAVD